MRCYSLALLAFPVVVCGLRAAPQQPPVVRTGIPNGPEQRYVDFASKIDQKGVALVLGTLGTRKEGKRERLPDGQLGGGNAVAVVSGTQFFKVAATVPIEANATLLGELPGKPQLGFELQIARLPDGTERRQLRTGAGSPIEDGSYGAFLVEPAPKGKTLQLVHYFPFVADQYATTEPKEAFLQEMTDFVALNRHVAALRTALAAVEAARTDAQKKAASAELKTVVEASPKPVRTENQGLFATHLGPLEQRGKALLAPPPAEEGSKEPEADGKGG